MRYRPRCVGPVALARGPPRSRARRRSTLRDYDTTSNRSGGNQTPPRFRATFTPSSRRRTGDDGTSTAYRTRKLARRGSETPNLHSIDATQYESSRECCFTPSAHLRRDHHAATGPVLLLAPPGRAHPTPLAARRRPQLGAWRRGARLEWRPLLALAGLGPNALRYAWSVKLSARPGSTPRGVEQSMLDGLGRLR